MVSGVCLSGQPAACLSGHRLDRTFFHARHFVILCYVGCKLLDVQLSYFHRLLGQAPLYFIIRLELEVSDLDSPTFPTGCLSDKSHQLSLLP